MKYTKIICTVGPSTESVEMLEKMIQAGMRVPTGYVCVCWRSFTGARVAGDPSEGERGSRRQNQHIPIGGEDYHDIALKIWFGVVVSDDPRTR
jgi:hypothetical protein